MELKSIPFYEIFENTDELQCEISAMDWFVEQMKHYHAWVREWNVIQPEIDFDTKEKTPWRVILRGSFIERDVDKELGFGKMEIK